MSDQIKELESWLAKASADGEENVETVDVLNDLATLYAIDGDPTRALDISRRAHRIAGRLDYEKGVAGGLGNEAFALYLLSNHEQALRTSHEAIAACEALDDSHGLGKTLGTLAAVLLSMGNYDEAFAMGLKALELQRGVGDRMREGWLLNGLGAGYHEVGDYDRAIEHHRQSLKIFKQIDHKVGKARALNGLGTVYQSKGEYEKAREYHDKSLLIFQEMHNKLGEARALNDLGLINQKLGEFDQALECHKKSLELREEVGNKQAQSTSLINLGNLFIEKKEAGKALDVLRRALAIATEIGARPRIYQANLALSEAHALQGDFSAALDHYKIYQHVKEEVTGDQAGARLRNLQVGYELDGARKEAEISRLKNIELKDKNQQLESLLHELREAQTQLVHTEKMAALGSLVAGVVHEINNPIGVIKSAADVSRRALQHVTETLDSSKSLDELRSDQRFRNALSTLESDTNVTLAATDRISKIVRDLKSVVRLDEADIQDVDLRDGLESTLSLLAHDFGNRIDVVKKLDDIPLVRCNPGDMNQAFMNLLLNASQAIDEKGTITVRTFERGARVHVEISDSGVGIPKVHMDRLFDPTISKKGARVKAGLGLFASYNILRKHKGEISVKSKVGKGTTFTLTLPPAADNREQSTG